MKYAAYVLFFALFLSACHADRSISQVSYKTTDAERQALRTATPDPSTPPPPDPERKMVYNANMELTVTEPDSVRDEVTAVAKRFDGYLLNASKHTVTIRLKSEHLQAAMEAVRGLGKVESQNISGKDVTDQFKDLNIRLENAQKARTRYLELLNKAINVEEALLVERELERLNREIDQLQGKLNQLQHLETFSTLTVHLRERVKPGLLGYVGIGVFRSVKWLFVRG